VFYKKVSETPQIKLHFVLFWENANCTIGKNFKKPVKIEFPILLTVTCQSLAGRCPRTTIVHSDRYAITILSYVTGFDFLSSNPLD